MSGHSKWSNIKNKKAKSDSAKARIFTKLGREIAVAVKSGGSDPSSNSRLYDAVASAKMNNMPNDNIQRSIKKAAGELNDINYEAMTYEGYGIGGSAVIIDALTDNKNRTAGDIRHHFDKYGGAIGVTNCVSFMFDKKGVIVCEKSFKLSDDDIFELTIEAGADDVNILEDVFEITTAPNDYSSVRHFFEQKNIPVLSASVQWLPQNTVTLDEESLVKFIKMIDAMEESDDIQNVFHNVNLPEEPEE